MLQSLIDGKESSQCIIIEDNVEVSGRGLLKCFLNSLTSRFDVVHVVLYEIPPSKFTQGLPPHLLSRLTIHDGVTDQLGWCPVGSTSHPVISLKTDLCEHLRPSRDVSSSDDVAVVIDSLDALILHRSPAYTCQTLHSLRRGLVRSEDADAARVVALLHGDLYDDVTLDLLRHTATSCIKVELPKDVINYQCASRVLHKRASGKILKAHEQFAFTDDLTVTDVTDVLHIKTLRPADPSPDPTSGITFNLSLSDSERAARSQLVLPYTRPPARHTDVISGGSAKIFYQPDDADDFDEEDPDDDLDI